MEYKNYRVRSPIKSFRDLEVYQKTIQLAEEVTTLEFLKEEQFQKDNEEIRELAQNIPKLIAESYGDKFDSKELANQKLTTSITLITDIITKIDLLKEKFKDKAGDDKKPGIEAQDKKGGIGTVGSNMEILTKLLSNYQRQKMKTLNLRKAWERIAEYDKTKNLNKR
jgi:hypothetical protein